MSDTLSPTTVAPVIKSRPVYGTLAPQPGGPHLCVADGEGALAILDLAALAAPAFFSAAQIAWVPHASAGRDHAERLRELRPRLLDIPPSIDAALRTLAAWLEEARMGTQLYVAGTEVLIGRAVQVAMDAGIDPAAVQAEHRGSLARRVQCVHCKRITEDVRTQPVRCEGCGLTLFVRDHYSRRYGAFMGVNIDAEEPGFVPPIEDAFA